MTPFFGPAYLKNSTLYVYCPAGDQQNYRLLSGQMSNAYFPVGFSDLGAKIVPRNFEGDTVKYRTKEEEAFYRGRDCIDRFRDTVRQQDLLTEAELAEVEALLKDKGATLWIQHDIVADAKLKKSPAFYD